MENLNYYIKAININIQNLNHNYKNE